MIREFTTDYSKILEAMDSIDPVRYGRTRNFIDGSVSYLSPYISRGVISTNQVLQKVLEKGYKLRDIYFFLRELCWRDYFQRVGQVKNLNLEIKQKQSLVSHQLIPSNVLTASTGIDGIDRAISQLYNTGYMHNHCRMYTASLVCNIAKSHWYHPALWMYYYLLDGDWASNACNWQWVAGANSNKKYFANQENINKYTHSSQSDTYLDTSYAVLTKMDIPVQLVDTGPFDATIKLPKYRDLNIQSGLPTFIYNYYNLDPEWRKDIRGNRILLLEPEFFSRYPVSETCMEFMLALGKNIPELQVYTGSFNSLVNTFDLKDIYYKEHPLNLGYVGIEDSREWIATEVIGYYPSFFAYWKQIEKHLQK